MARLLLSFVVLAMMISIALTQTIAEIKALCDKAACGMDECRIYGINLDFAAMCVPRPKEWGFIF